ncbi:Two-component response regulator ARR8 [Platanthera zijinensis]|uniref:Two-component response regulator ARR8 n=1 Tax=Platanthera zijinensis TaxID=2320716 RepID=A0AAP0B721_9ASPA
MELAHMSIRRSFNLSHKLASAEQDRDIAKDDAADLARQLGIVENIISKGSGGVDVFVMPFWFLEVIGLHGGALLGVAYRTSRRITPLAATVISTQSMPLSGFGGSSFVTTDDLRQSGAEATPQNFQLYRCLEEGADEFFLKPVQLSDMQKLRPHILKGKFHESSSSSSRIKFSNDNVLPEWARIRLPLAIWRFSSFFFSPSLLEVTPRLPALGKSEPAIWTRPPTEMPDKDGGDRRWLGHSSLPVTERATSPSAQGHAPPTISLLPIPTGLGKSFAALGGEPFQVKPSSSRPPTGTGDVPTPDEFVYLLSYDHLLFLISPASVAFNAISSSDVDMSVGYSPPPSMDIILEYLGDPHDAEGMKKRVTGLFQKQSLLLQEVCNMVDEDKAETEDRFAVLEGMRPLADGDGTTSLGVHITRAEE